MDELIRRGRALHAVLTDDPREQTATAQTRVWQQECETAVRQLSGGNKTHWVSRAYSDALLVRTASGRAADGADLAVIVERIIAVLDRAARALAEARETGTAAVADGRVTTRFNFVHDANLRPLLEQAYTDGRLALDERRYHDALLAFCGTLEATITDALVYQRPEKTHETAGLSFGARIAAAEQARLIRNGCARLPAVARAYRDPSAAASVTEADARTAGQVLRTIMRDLDPGR